MTAGPFFQFSRSPAEALLSGPEHETEARLTRHGFETLDRFLRRLAKLSQVEYTDLRITPVSSRMQ